MEQPHFQEWFDEIFLKHANSIEGPKVLIFDGHRSHITLNIVESARNNNIHIILLPPHTTHVLQPLDVAVFKPVKTELIKVIMNHNTNSNCADITQKDFPKLLKDLVESKKVFLLRHAVAGFETTGIYPLDKDNMLGQIDSLDIQNDGSVDLFEQNHNSSSEILISTPRLLLKNKNQTENPIEILNQEKENNKEKVNSYSISSQSLNSSQSLESKVNEIQQRIDKYESSNTKNLFAKDFGTVITNTVNSRIKQRSSGKCITSDESYRFLVEDKEQKQRKVQIANEKELLRIEQAKLKLVKDKLVLEIKQKKEDERLKKKAEADEKLAMKNDEKSQLKKKKVEIQERKALNKSNRATNNQISCYNCDEIFNPMDIDVIFKSCRSCNSWFCSNCFFTKDDEDELKCNFCTL